MAAVADAAGVPNKVTEAMIQASGGGLMRPELLNRIDEVIVFHQLKREEIEKIVEIQLARLRDRLSERGVTLALTEEARRAIADEGWDPAFGARPLKRAIQQRIENALASRILSGEIREGDAVTVDVRGKSYVFERTAAALAR
jgi:ATP-dependent Clp protease ATP-binding subunit ClpB